ncbi:MAG: hypothetical protein GEV10_09705 [Streptosporangiales bacterium]|nr:hypothetical protein [Streptosporangiales bacterium]
MTATASKKKLTRTCQDTFTTARVVTSLEKAWTAIRDAHPELPQAVLIVGPGTLGKHPVWGHFGALKWQHGTDRLPEILIAGEGLNRPAPEILTTLLHEGAHALADVREIKDTSRQGRWHNKKFGALADELGLDTAKDESIGWSLTKARPDTLDTYKTTLRGLEKALTAWRHPELRASSTRTTSNNGSTCLCGCPRRIRVSTTVLDLGPIICSVCDEYFTPDQDGASS